MFTMFNNRVLLVMNYHKNMSFLPPKLMDLVGENTIITDPKIIAEFEQYESIVLNEAPWDMGKDDILYTFVEEEDSDHKITIFQFNEGISVLAEFNLEENEVWSRIGDLNDERIDLNIFSLDGKQAVFKETIYQL